MYEALLSGIISKFSVNILNIQCILTLLMCSKRLLETCTTQGKGFVHTQCLFIKARNKFSVLLS